jgi:hypothetical protein
MKTRTLISIILMGLIVSSCVLSSLFPLYNEKDLMINDIIIGKWKIGDENDSMQYWFIEKVDTTDNNGGFLGQSGTWSEYKTGKTYRLVAQQDSIEQDFALHLLELNGVQYIDLYPVNFEVSPDFLAWHMVPTHIFGKIEIYQNQLIIRFFDQNFFVKLIEQNKIRISHVDMNGRQLITAQTDEIQKFAKKYVDQSQAFQKPDTLPRLPI